MSDTCQTVQIKSAEMGAVTINEADFDPAKHELFVADAPVSSGLGTDSGDQFTEAELRAVITEVTGKAPHHKAGYGKLVSMFNELNKDA